MASKDKSVTLTKNGRKVTLTIPQDIVQYRAAGWREEAGQEAAEAPVADSPQDVDERPSAAPKPSAGPAVGSTSRPEAAQTGKGGAQK